MTQSRSYRDGSRVFRKLFYAMYRSSTVSPISYSSCSPLPPAFPLPSPIIYFTLPSSLSYYFFTLPSSSPIASLPSPLPSPLAFHPSPLPSPPTPFQSMLSPARSRRPASPPPRRGRGKGHGRGQGRGKGRGRGQGHRIHRQYVSPLTFPNCSYSFSNPPPFKGDPQGPKFSLQNPMDATAYSYFSLFFDGRLLQHKADQTNLYARLNPFTRVKYQWTDTSVEEIKSYLGIIISTGYVVLPNLVDYWETNSIFSQSGIVKGMSRNFFEQLCGQLHFNDALAYGNQGMISFTK